MIVTNVGGLAELVPNNKVGFVCEVDKDQIVQAIFNYYTQQKEQAFAQAMEHEKQRFTWPNLCNQLLNLV